jgi:hypothetical protein
MRQRVAAALDSSVCAGRSKTSGRPQSVAARCSRWLVSGVRWARENAPVAEVVVSESVVEIARVLNRLSQRESRA